MEESTTRAGLLEPVFFEDNDALSDAERFQNKVLRPVLKFQNDLLCLVAVEACVAQDPGFASLPARKRDAFISKTLTANQPLKSQLLGVVMGMLDAEQLRVLLADRKEFAKRVHAMVQKRVVEKYGSFL